MLFFENLCMEVLLTNDDVKQYIDFKFDEVNQKIDNLHSLFEKIRNNEVRTLMYAQLACRLLNALLYIDQLRNASVSSSTPIYENIKNDEYYKKAHTIVKNCAKDLCDLVVKKSKGRKDLLEDEFTNSLAFISGIDETLL